MNPSVYARIVSPVKTLPGLLPTCLILGAVGFLVATPCARAQSDDSQAEPLVIPRASSEIVIDGVVAESAWSDALVVALEVETNPGDNVAPPVKTDDYSSLVGST